MIYSATSGTVLVLGWTSSWFMWGVIVFTLFCGISLFLFTFRVLEHQILQTLVSLVVSSNAFTLLFHLYSKCTSTIFAQHSTCSLDTLLVSFIVVSCLIISVIISLSLIRFMNCSLNLVFFFLTTLTGF